LIARLIADGYASGAFDRNLHPMVTMLSFAGMAVVPQMIRRALEGQLPFPNAPAGEKLSKLLVGVLFSGTGTPTATPAK